MRYFSENDFVCDYKTTQHHKDNCCGKCCKNPCCCIPGPVGPQGPAGPQGPVGTITGSVDSVDDLPYVGNQGDAYLVNGVLYVWNAEGSLWRPVGNLIGPQGPAGPQGPVGTITGSVDSVNDLPEVGNQGDAYLVNGVLYVWNVETSTWEAVGNLIGPQGPEGPQGPQGPVGTITGSVDSVNDLPEVGNQGDAYLVNGVLYVWNAETSSWEAVGNLIGPAGPEGPQGPQGPVGTITGSVDSVNDLPEVGNQGDAYLVNGVLYVWNAETSSWEAVGDLRGPAGPEGSSYTIIPFASQVAPLTHISGGNPSEVSLIGFGYGDARPHLTDVDDYAFTISPSDHSFNLDENGNFQVVFSLPFDMTIRSVALTTGNYGDFNPQGEVYPYVQLYSAEPESNTFMPIIDTVTEPATPLGPGFVPANNLRSVVKDGLEINLEAGTRIAIGALARMTTDTTTQAFYLYFTGGIGMTRWIR